MQDVPIPIQKFLSLKRIAVAGISGKNSPANAIFRKFIHAGYTVFPVHPELDEFEGVRCYRRLSEIPEKPEGVFMLTRPEVSENIVDECISCGISQVWMHNMSGFQDEKNARKSGITSVSPEAVAKAQAAEIQVIAGSCPMQFIPPVDVFHKCIRWFSSKTGKLELESSEDNVKQS